MIIIFKLIGAVATITALITYTGMKLVEWWECGRWGSMSKLIDASNLKNTIHEKSFNSGMMNPIFTYAEIMNMVDVSPTIHAIPLDKIKQAREKMESKLYVGTEEITGLVCLDLGVTKCLEILDKLIESEDKEWQ